MYPRSQSAEQETLQADVMRFMAIIALSLVAIMSLVNEAAPDDRSAPTPRAIVAEPPTDEIRPVEPASPSRTLDEAPPRRTIVLPAPVAPPDVTARIDEAPLPTPAAHRDEAARVEEPGVAPRQPVEDLRPTDRVTSIVEPVAEPPPEPVAVKPVAARPVAAKPVAAKPVAATPPAPNRQRGLQLRFQSEQAFLGLVARGAIDVYAYRPGEVLQLSPTFALQASRAPGEVYNLAVGTVPAAIRRGALDPAFTWAVALPAATRREIQRHIDRRAHGVIEIQSTGAVRHVPSH